MRRIFVCYKHLIRFSVKILSFIVWNVFFSLLFQRFFLIHLNNKKRIKIVFFVVLRQRVRQWQSKMKKKKIQFKQNYFPSVDVFFFRILPILSVYSFQLCFVCRISRHAIYGIAFTFIIIYTISNKSYYSIFIVRSVILSSYCLQSGITRLIE